jgi:hypothetical protein
MSHEERFDRIDANIAELKESMAQLARYAQESIERLTQYVLDFREETARHFEVIDNRLDVLTAIVANIEARYPAFNKAILDFGKLATHLTNDQARNKNASAELASRAGRLEEQISKIINPAA